METKNSMYQPNNMKNSINEIRLFFKIDSCGFLKRWLLFRDTDMLINGIATANDQIPLSNTYLLIFC